LCLTLDVIEIAVSCWRYCFSQPVHGLCLFWWCFIWNEESKPNETY